MSARLRRATRRVARVGRDPRPRARAGRWSRPIAVGGAAARARHPGVLGMHTAMPGLDSCPQPADHADLRPHPGRRSPAARAGVRGRPGRRRRPPRRSSARIDAAAGARARAPARFSQPITVEANRDALDRERLASRSTATAPTRAPRRRWPCCATTSFPPRSARCRGAEANVAGDTAGTKDFNDMIKSRPPIVFAFVLGAGVPAAARDLPVDRDPDRRRSCSTCCRSAPPTACSCSSSRTATGEAARLPLDRRHHVMAAAVPVRDPVRAVDGLPRVHPQPDPRGGRRRHAHRARGRPRHQADRRRRDQRGRS